MILKGFTNFLVESGFINTQQLSECQKERDGSQKDVVECLVEKEFLTQEALAKAFAKYASLDYIDSIVDKMADVLLLAKVPLIFLRANHIIPVRIDDQLTLVVADPTEVQSIDELNMLLGGGAQTVVAPAKVILDAINRYYPLEGSKEMIEELEEEGDKEIGEVEFEDIKEKDILAMASEAPIIKLVNQILYQAAKRRASDIHIEPFEKELSVRYRIDGVMYEVMKPPKRIQGALVSRIKIMSNLNIAEKRVPQDGRIDIRIAGKPIDIRVSVLPVNFGERIVMRLLDKTRGFAKLEDLGMSEHDFKLIMRSIARPNGIVYVTGPTGSGKTTTLYSVLGRLNTSKVNIITVEDPVEYQMTGISQVQVKTKVGMTFAAALRSILRQDPDIVMIGETRDQETAQIAVQAALTGHLVLSTLHTNNAPASITRLIDMGVEPYLIASSVVLIMAQRLVRKLCPLCKQVYKPQKDVLASIGITEHEAKSIIFYKQVGCSECNETGYNGRFAIYEMMTMTPELAKLTVDRSDTSLLRKQAIEDGMILLVQDGLRKIREGITTIEEVLSVATIEHEVVE